MWNVSWRQTPEQLRRGGQISLAGLTPTVRTCVTPRKYLPEEHTGVTASTGIASDHKSDFRFCRIFFFVRMNRCTSTLPGVITISAGLAGGCDMSCEIVVVVAGMCENVSIYAEFKWRKTTGDKVLQRAGVWFLVDIFFFLPSLQCQGNTLVWMSVDLDRTDRWVTRVSLLKKEWTGLSSSSAENRTDMIVWLT